jgi:hypothetical protein
MDLGGTQEQWQFMQQPNVSRRLSTERHGKARRQFGLRCCHLLVARLSITHHSLLKIEDLDLYWTPGHLFREVLPVQVLLEVHPREGVPEMSFPDLVARFETNCDAYPRDPCSWRAIDNVSKTLDRLR